jgi:hypothetical protein
MWKCIYGSRPQCFSFISVIVLYHTPKRGQANDRRRKKDQNRRISERLGQITRIKEEKWRYRRKRKNTEEKNEEETEEKN